MLCGYGDPGAIHVYAKEIELYKEEIILCYLSIAPNVVSIYPI